VKNTTLPPAAAVAAALAAGLGLVLWDLQWFTVERGGDPAEPLPPEYFDQGIACLAEGEVQPSLGALSERELFSVAGIIGRLLHAYGAGAFGSFLALRAVDLDFADHERAGDVESLRVLAENFAPPLEIGSDDWTDDWIGALGAYWRRYYDRPPVARFAFERARVELHREGLGRRSLEEWERSFEALRDRDPGAWILHTLAVPHRRDVERVASDAGPLQWLDLDLAFETPDGTAARLVTRFVWDSVLESWFLHAAATVYPNGDRSERHLIL
jgi:hypothetical protein